MKKQILLLSVAGLLAACQSEELAETQAQGDVSRVRMEVADYVWADETRTSAELSGNSVQFKWMVGDVIGIFGEVGDQVSFPISKGFDSPTAEFDGGVWALRSGCKYVAYHPYSYDNRDRTAIPVSYEGQKQTGNGTVAHLTERDVLVSELTAPTSGEVTFHFDHLGGVARVKLTVPDADTYTKFTLSAPTAVFPVEQTLNLITNSLSDKTLSDHIDLTLSGISTTSANEVVTLYLLLPPADLTGTELTATLTGAKADYTATVTGKTLTRGGAVAYTVTVEKFVTADYNGHAYVDLALPSGLKWATCNVGATTPEGYGNYYAWGEVMTKSDYSWSTYLTNLGGTMSSTIDCGTEKDPLRSYVYPNNVSIAGTQYDAARHNWGGTWRMPTDAEMTELRNTSYCTWTWTTRNGVSGRLVTSKSNGNSIFLPAAGYRATSLSYAGSLGYYWSASPGASFAYDAFGLYFGSDNFSRSCSYRFFGRPVRPVSELLLSAKS